MNDLINNSLRTDFLRESFFRPGREKQFLNHDKVAQQQTNQSHELLPASDVGSLDYVFANGYIRAQFTSPGLKKEFERCLLPLGGKGKMLQYMPENHQVLMRKMNLTENIEDKLYEVLSQPQNRYIAREMQWTLVNPYDSDVYNLIPFEAHLKKLIAAIKPRSNKLPRPVMVLGSASMNISGSETNDLPDLAISKVEAVNPSAIIKAITQTLPDANVDNLKQLVADILSLGANDGDQVQDRALNYLLYNNFAIYSRSYEIIYENSAANNGGPAARLTGIQVLPQMSGNRIIVKVVFDYQNISGGCSQSWYSVVDVTDEYPFLLVPFSRYLPRY